METSGGVAQCQLFSQANWRRASSNFGCFNHAANVILSKYLARWLKKAVFILSFVHLFICLFCHTSIRSLLQTLTVVSRNVAIEKINMTEHRIVEMVGGTWYHVLRLTIDYNFAFISSFLSPLWRNLTFFLFIDTHIFRVCSSSYFTFWETATYVQHTLEKSRREMRQKGWKTLKKTAIQSDCGQAKWQMNQVVQKNLAVPL